MCCYFWPPGAVDLLFTIIFYLITIIKQLINYLPILISKIFVNNSPDFFGKIIVNNSK